VPGDSWLTWAGGQGPASDKDLLQTRPAESLSASYKSKGNFTAAVFFFSFSRKIQNLLLDKQFDQTRQVQYLANGVKVENPVYILSNEMLKFIYDSYESRNLRITECWGLEGTSVGHLVKLPC